MSNIRRGKDPEDRKRISDLNRAFMPRELKTYTSRPDVKQIRNGSLFLYDDGTNKHLCARLGDTLIKLQGTEF